MVHIRYVKFAYVQIPAMSNKCSCPDAVPSIN